MMVELIATLQELIVQLTHNTTTDIFVVKMFYETESLQIHYFFFCCNALIMRKDNKLNAILTNIFRCTRIQSFFLHF